MESPASHARFFARNPGVLRRLWPAAALAVLASGTAHALADGFFAPKIAAMRTSRAESIVASPKQEALIVCDADRIEVTLRTHFLAGPEELAWVVPVPKRPEKVEQADDAIFDLLQKETAPEFLVMQRSRGFGFGCGGSVQQTGSTGRVTVLESGQAGIFDYTVLGATGADALAEWLDAHGYAVPPGAKDVFEHYVEDGWCWLAVRLSVEAARQSTLAPHPIRYVYRDARLVYPLVISRLSADAQTEVLLYVLAGGQHGCGNWKTVEIEGELAADPSSPSGTNYEKLFLETVRRHRGRAFVAEFAADLDTVGYRPLLSALKDQDVTAIPESKRRPCYLTRLRTVVPPEGMDRDVAILPMRTGEYDFILNTHTIIARAAPREDFRGAAATVAGLALVLAGCAAVRRRVGLQNRN